MPSNGRPLEEEEEEEEEIGSLCVAAMCYSPVSLAEEFRPLPV
jgi:hypothetical protein